MWQLPKPPAWLNGDYAAVHRALPCIVRCLAAWALQLGHQHRLVHTLTSTLHLTGHPAFLRPCIHHIRCQLERTRCASIHTVNSHVPPCSATLSRLAATCSCTTGSLPGSARSAGSSWMASVMQPTTPCNRSTQTLQSPLRSSSPSCQTWRRRSLQRPS